MDKVMTPEEAERCVVAICECGGLVYAAVNTERVMDTEAFKEIGLLVKKGCKIEHWTVLQVRECKRFGCKCYP